MRLTKKQYSDIVTSGEDTLLELSALNEKLAVTCRRMAMALIQGERDTLMSETKKAVDLFRDISGMNADLANCQELLLNHWESGGGISELDCENTVTLGN
jgi:hypothetical protein